MFLITPEAGVPDYVVEQPVIIEEAFDHTSRHSIDYFVAKSTDFVAARVPLYDPENSNPAMALAQKKGNCASRAALFHGLFSTVPHLLSGIIITYSHAYNVVVEREGLHGAVINNSMYAEEEEESGTYIDTGTLTSDIGTIAVKEEATMYNLFGSLLKHAHERRHANGGLIELWRISLTGSGIERITSEKPSVPENYASNELRPYAILLGKSATHYVNSLSGHRPIRSGNRAQEVAKGLEALKGHKTIATATTRR